jgi:hypothetical protein
LLRGRGKREELAGFGRGDRAFGRSESLPKWPWEVLSFVAMPNAKLRIVIFQDGEWLCAHCLEYNLATQAKNLDDLRYDLERMIVGHIAVSLANGLKPFRNGRRAPEKYWAMFRRSKISLPQQSFGLRTKKRGVKIPTPEIRVAALAA